MEELKKVAKSIDCPLGHNWPELQRESFEDLKPIPGLKNIEDLAKLGYKMVNFE